MPIFLSWCDGWDSLSDKEETTTLHLILKFISAITAWPLPIPLCLHVNMFPTSWIVHSYILQSAHSRLALAHPGDRMIGCPWHAPTDIVALSCNNCGILPRPNDRVICHCHVTCDCPARLMWQPARRLAHPSHLSLIVATHKRPLLATLLIGACWLKLVIPCRIKPLIILFLLQLLGFRVNLEQYFRSLKQEYESHLIEVI